MKPALEESVEAAPETRNTVAERLRAGLAREERRWGQDSGNRAREFVVARKWSRDSEEGELACAVHSLDASSFRSTHCDHRKARGYNLTAGRQRRQRRRRMVPLGSEECSEVDERRDPDPVVAEEEVGRKLHTVVSAELRRG